MLTSFKPFQTLYGVEIAYNATVNKEPEVILAEDLEHAKLLKVGLKNSLNTTSIVKCTLRWQLDESEEDW